MGEEYEFIKYQVKNGTAWISINRPEVFNALNRKSKEEICRAISSGNSTDQVSCIILTGEGKAFCSGQDLNDRGVKGSSPDLAHTLKTEWLPMINDIRNSKKIVIAAINGVVAGAGLSLAVAADFLISRPKVKFVSGFSQIGLAPDAGSSYYFSRGLGYQKALEFFLFNDPLYSEDLKNAGIINWISEDPLNFATEISEKLAALPAKSVELIKSNLQFSRENSFSDTTHKEMEVQGFLGKTLDYQEGIKAFLEKRKPQFIGK